MGESQWGILLGVGIYNWITIGSLTIIEGVRPQLSVTKSWPNLENMLI